MLSCRKQLSLKRNVFTVHVGSLDWNCILGRPNVNTPPAITTHTTPPPPASFFLVSYPQSLPFGVSAPDPDGPRRGASAWHHRRTPTSCPTRSLASCPLAWSHPQVWFGLGLQRSVIVAKALIRSVWVSSISLFLSVTHTQAHTHTASPPVASPQLVLEMATSPKWHMHPTTRHQPLTRLPKTDLLLNPRKLKGGVGENKLEWRSFLSDYSSRCCILPWVHSN